MSKTSTGSTTRISSYVIMIIFVTLILSLTALILAINAIYANEQFFAWVLLLIGFAGVAISSFWLFQTRRRLMHVKIEAPPIKTTIECIKCGIKNVREFQRGDYIFKEGEPCQKCNDKMIITAIYREVTEREKEKERVRTPF
jgi:ABC-type dipeptide/oligopeptide/nickel transport system permease component